MAGIGFELRKILKRDSLLSLIQAYAQRRDHQLWGVGCYPSNSSHRDFHYLIVLNVLVTQFQVSVTMDSHQPMFNRLCTVGVYAIYR
ncbi:MAG: hypothetical protein U1E88_05835 [Acinetobacter sp.]